MKYILNQEGKLEVNGSSGTYKYFITDHLGNTRLVEGEGINSQASELNHYYPFGLRMAMANTKADADQKYLYNGKELQEEVDWLDYGARMYDASIARFTTADPLAEEFSSWTPYHYVHNNPINLIDPTGMFADGYTIDEYGEINRVNNTGGDEYDVLYTKKDYEQAKLETKETGEKNDFGNPEPVNSVKVSSGTFDQSNMISLGDVKGIKVNNKSDAAAIYKFAADNFSVEYGMVSGLKDENMSIVHTSGQENYTETPKVAKHMIDQGYFIEDTHHSHPGGVDYGKPSGFYTNGEPVKPLGGDAKAAKWMDQKNGFPINHYMYHPHSGKTHQYNHKKYVEVK